MPSQTARQREIDAAFFEDWSSGQDAHGLWLWVDWRMGVIIVRPTGATMTDIVAKLGGVRQSHHRYDHEERRDWYVPPKRWREVRAALPRLVALRQARINATEPSSRRHLNGVCR